uniref:Uncharacterized protein n=1 Tax=Glossina pallidipes TaxID=7398 RepID=A0A1A9ZB25_GLOPL
MGSLELVILAICVLLGIINKICPFRMQPDATFLITSVPISSHLFTKAMMNVDHIKASSLYQGQVDLDIGSRRPVFLKVEHGINTKSFMGLSSSSFLETLKEKLPSDKLHHGAWATISITPSLLSSDTFDAIQNQFTTFKRTIVKI